MLADFQRIRATVIKAEPDLIEFIGPSFCIIVAALAYDVCDCTAPRGFSNTFMVRGVTGGTEAVIRVSTT